MTRRAIVAKSAPVAKHADAPLAEKKKPFSFRVTVTEFHYLHVGDVIQYQGRDHVVTMVNDSCARIVPVTEGQPREVTIKPRFGDKPVKFLAPERNSVVAISANSEVEIKRRLGVNWRERL